MGFNSQTLPAVGIMIAASSGLAVFEAGGKL
jgi:hypothetical protein